MRKPNLPDIPEFSDNNYTIVGYVVGTLVSVTGVFFLYEVFADGDLTFKANWNMFDSVLIWPLYIIGLLVMFANWSTFSFSYDTYEKITFSDGRTEVRRVGDIIEWMMGHIVVPIIGRFLLVPCFVAALIYYPIQCVIALVGSIFPYILALLVVGVMTLGWMFTRWFSFRYHSVVLIVFSLVFCVAFAWGGIAIRNAGPGATIQMVGDFPQGADDEFAEDEFAEDEFAEDEFADDVSSTADGDDFTSEPSSGGTGSDDEFADEDEDDQFAGFGEEGLYGCLPEGTTEFEGEMDAFPIEFTITKVAGTDNITAVYKNVRSGTIINLVGESLPAMAGNINFSGTLDGKECTFYLGGDCDNISGTADGDGKQYKVTLHRKQ